METLSIVLRDFTPEDRPFLLSAIAQLNDHERALHDTRLPGAEIAEAYFNKIHGKIATDHGCIVVAFNGDERVGYMACRIETDDAPAETADSNVFGYISDVFVVAGMRGRNIAALLVAEAERRVRPHGVTRLRLGSLASNEQAIRAYRKAGFSDYEVVLEKRL
ncbi:MAG: GNAT family N-acetyltransferase [Alphaproteobacteria bacterium]|nr:GNAT family N-acetyltransferase [Alphaproteobacteria bacterium]MCW5738587.1 GNAT family N-acetyltransferase [Alphaproteobacteria bacterium]